MSSKPTLRDIAEATGVSTASVSMILNGKIAGAFFLSARGERSG